MSPTNGMLVKLRPIFFSLLMASLLLCGGGLVSVAQQPEQEKIKERLYSLRAKNKNYQKDTTYIDLLLQLGMSLRFYKADSLYTLAKQALKFSRDSGYKNGESKSLLRMGDYFSDKGTFDKAIDLYTEALEIAEATDNKRLILRTMNNLAGEYAYMGDYARALGGYLDGIELASEVDDKKILSIMNENIANLYASQKDYEQSLVFYKRVKQINDEIGNDVYAAETMSNLASVYADMGKLDYAKFNINQSIAIFERQGIDDWLAFAYEIKGKIYLKEENHKWALYWYDQSELIHRRLEDERAKIDLYNGMAEAYLGIGIDSVSQKYALMAFDISNRIKFVEGTQKCAKTLYNISKNSGDYETALNYHELYQRLSDTLSRDENKKSLTMLKTKMDYDKQKRALIEANEKELSRQRGYINAALFILLIFIVVTLLVHRGQKIQKKLNLKLQHQKTILEVREKELEENIDTKNKLFSIIGHDLRGPIGALQTLLKMYKNDDIGKTDFWDFIPKLRDDIDHISFTLNNLLSWGYTQMNGAVTKPAVVPLENLVHENVKLLAEVADGKSIKIVNEIPEQTLAWVDTNQVDIVIRNLISNALKFTPENGLVVISCTDQGKEWEISVRDSGVGMDKITSEKIFQKNSNITTYGTNNEKGTGLGLSLCKEMVMKNNGRIWVESSLRKGSTFYFTLPKAEKKFSKAS